MNKKLMLLAVGALTALAFAALPALASATEYEAHCQDAKGNTVAICEGEVTGGTAELRNSNNEIIKCTGTGGTTSFATTTTTGTANLKFTGCKEQATIFKFNCNSVGSGTGIIEAANLTYHLINLESGVKTPGIKFTGISVTFTCAGFSDKTVTGSVVGHMHDPATICNQALATHSVNFQEKVGGPVGTQTWMQTETTGTKTDLISNNDAGGTYFTSSQVATGTIHWKDGNLVKITC